MSKRLSERLADLLTNLDEERQYVVMTAGAVDELIKLVETAEAVVELRASVPDPYAVLGFDAEYHRQLDQAILRFGSILG